MGAKTAVRGVWMDGRSAMVGSIMKCNGEWI